MTQELRIRQFRLKYNISLTELGRYAGISHQHISRIELGIEAPSVRAAAAIEQGLWQIVEGRKQQNAALEAEYWAARESLFDIGILEEEHT